MQPFHVKNIIKYIGNGCTNPTLALLDNGNNDVAAVIKTKNNEQGILSLVNEFICYMLCKRLGILVPKCGIATIDYKTQIPKEINIGKDDFGSCFFSTYIQESYPLNESIMDFISNKEMYEDIVLFDHIVYNKDRNMGNLLVSSNKSGTKLYAIDHSHTFKNGTVWDKYCFIQGEKDNDYLDEDILLSNKYLYNLFLTSKQIGIGALLIKAEKYRNITAEEIKNIINMLPKDWIVAAGDLNALIDYLMYRIKNINSICSTICVLGNGGIGHE